jgi:ParB-like nuclease domain
MSNLEVAVATAAAAAVRQRLPFIPVHPLADLFPLMEGAEFDELVADIKKNGQREPIVLYDGMILDGRNRVRACLAAGLPKINCRHPKIDDPAAYVVSANIRRRHLSAEQKRDLIRKVLEATPERSDRSIAKQVGVSHPTVAAVREEVESRKDHSTGKSFQLGEPGSASAPTARRVLYRRKPAQPRPPSVAAKRASSASRRRRKPPSSARSKRRRPRPRPSGLPAT